MYVSKRRVFVAEGTANAKALGQEYVNLIKAREQDSSVGWIQ